jgi:hypothetical protein
MRRVVVGLSLTLVGAGAILACGRTQEDEPHAAAGAPEVSGSLGGQLHTPDVVGGGGTEMEDPPDAGRPGTAGSAIGGASGAAGQPGDDWVLKEGTASATDCRENPLAIEIGGALARFCVLYDYCEYTPYNGIYDCLWFQEPFHRLGACRATVQTCEDLAVCLASIEEPELLPCAGPDIASCADGVLHVCDGGTLREEDCASRGLICDSISDPQRLPTLFLGCHPPSCDIIYEGGDTGCNGEYLWATGEIEGFSTMSRVRLHCPDFGFSRCEEGRCVP